MYIKKNFIQQVPEEYLLQIRPGSPLFILLLSSHLSAQTPVLLTFNL